jgi:hypothetical protein
MLPKSAKNYPMTFKERETLDKWLDEELAKEYI